MTVSHNDSPFSLETRLLIWLGAAAAGIGFWIYVFHLMGVW